MLPFGASTVGGYVLIYIFIIKDYVFSKVASVLGPASGSLGFAEKGCSVVLLSGCQNCDV